MHPQHQDTSRNTKTVHAGNEPSYYTHNPLVPPIYTTTTFETLEPEIAQYDYSRASNPTRAELEMHLAKIEGARYALSFSSGMGALTTLSYLIQSGQHVLCSDDVYGGTNKFLNHCAKRMGIETTFINGSIIENWTNNFKPGHTKLVWIESPTNPTLQVFDIKAIVKAVKKIDKHCTVVVDNTIMTPVFQSPLLSGCDIVMHSCSQFINGHSDLLMGAIMTNDEIFYERLKYLRTALGIIPSSFDCYLTIRSIKTMHIRIRRQAKGAMQVAQFLEQHRRVRRVFYPGLDTHPQQNLVERDYLGYGSVITFYVQNFKGDEAIRISQKLRVFSMAPSMGSFCSLVDIPSIMSHSSTPSDERNSLGVTENLMRISIGLEDPEDLILDLNFAINSAYVDC